MIDALDNALDERGRRWLETALARIEEREQAILELFPAAARNCGRGPLPDSPGWTIDQAARARLLLTLPSRDRALGDLLFELYRYGDASERIAVLKSLALLDGLGEHGSAIVRDALRTNDTRLIEAAVGEYGGKHLTDEEFRQAVLKCVFVGVPLEAVAGLDDRADRELARMLADFALERDVAGRSIPEDIWPVVRRYPDMLKDHEALLEGR